MVGLTKLCIKCWQSYSYSGTI